MSNLTERLIHYRFIMRIADNINHKKLYVRITGTSYCTTMLADMGSTQEQPQNHGWNAKSKFIFITSQVEGSPKQHPGRGTQVWTDAPQRLVLARELPHLLLLPICQGSVPQQGKNLKHIQQGASEATTRLAEHRCSTCQALETKRRLVWYLCFSPSQLQVTSACLQSSSPIFGCFPATPQQQSSRQSC